MIDVGANAGTLCRTFKEAAARSGHRALPGHGRGRPALPASTTMKDYFGPGMRTARRRGIRGGTIVTAANVFAHIGDVHGVIEGVVICSRRTASSSASPITCSTPETLQYDTIYHEHLRYYRWQPRAPVRAHGLEVFPSSASRPTAGRSASTRRAGEHPVGASVAAMPVRRSAVRPDRRRARRSARASCARSSALRCSLIEARRGNGFSGWRSLARHHADQLRRARRRHPGRVVEVEGFAQDSTSTCRVHASRCSTRQALPRAAGVCAAALLAHRRRAGANLRNADTAATSSSPCRSRGFSDGMPASGPEAGSETSRTALRRALTGWVPKVGLSVAVAALFLWLALRQVDLRELRRAFGLLNPAGAWPGSPSTGSRFSCGFFRWRYIMNAVTSLSVRQVTLGLLTGYAVNAILPAAEIGSVSCSAPISAAALSRPRSTTLGTIWSNA